MSSDINEVDVFVELNQQQLDFLQLHPTANFTEVINLQMTPSPTKEELFDSTKCIADIRERMDMFKYAAYSFVIFDSVVKKNFALCNQIGIGLNIQGIASVEELAIYRGAFLLQNIDITEYN